MASLFVDTERSRSPLLYRSPLPAAPTAAPPREYCYDTATDTVTCLRCGRGGWSGCAQCDCAPPPPAAISEHQTGRRDRQPSTT